MGLRWKVAQAAEIRWWKKYLAKKDVDTYLNWKKKYWIDFLKKLNLQIPIGVTCLDAGCGPAGIFTVLDEQTVTALDPLLDQYTQELDHFQPEHYKNVTFINTALEKFQPTQSYDYIFCLNAINHVNNLAQSLDNLFQAGRKGTQIIISVDAHNYKGFKYLFKSLPGDILHPHQYDLKEYVNMLHQYNINIKDTILVKKEFFFAYYAIILEV
ncbi:MAG: methyltransferase [Saprospiraceae bacterium]|nr:methyltransferase [Saprospiraceae bacterium]